VKVSLFRWLLLVLLVSALAHAESLPQWSNEDRDRLLRGEIIAGTDILVEDEKVMASLGLRLDSDSEVLRALPPELKPEPEYDPKMVSSEFLPLYFTSSESYLIDPQQLLSKQEALDRLGFLEYHADESELKIRMYLFDSEQNLPSSYTIEKLCEDHYAEAPLTAIVFCFLGNPERTQLAFAGRGAAEVVAVSRRKMLESAMLKAMEKSDPAMQLESFIVQLSISLYWLWTSGKGVGKAEVVAATDAGGLSALKSHMHWIILGFLGLLCLVAGCVFGWLMWTRSRRYHFPVVEMPERLGASYAAGVGAVIAFHKKLGSPSSQRNQVPDYLKRV
jgi:hypothetical protein